MANPEIPQSRKFESYNQLQDEAKTTEYKTMLIEILKRKPILLSQALQIVNDITTTGAELSGLAAEGLRKDSHYFRFYFVAPYSDEDICRLVYSSDDKRGLCIEAFSECSFIGKYYQNQLEAVATSRKIPFEKVR